MALSFVRLKMKYFCSMNIFSGTLLDWYAENKRDLPWRNTTDPYLIWISEIILQQTRVAQGYEYFLRFIKRFPDVVSLAAASEDEVMKYWQGLGYYSRARNLHAAAKSMKGTFPKTYAEVRALKGVGDYTAAAICSFAYDMPYAAVDGNVYGSPDKSGGKFFNSIENLHLCTMNNQGLLALAQLILPSEILSNFEVVRVEEEASLIRIYLDESVKAEYKENPEIESKGFCEAVTIRDFPIRDKGVDLIVRRRKWYDKQNNRYFSDSYDLKAEETRYSKEFAAFLKGVYGDDSYDLPFA